MACSTEPAPEEPKTQRVTIGLNSTPSDLSSQGVPKPVGGGSAVSIEGEITVFKGNTKVLFDQNGNITTNASNSTPLLITRATPTISLNLEVNVSYRFEFLGYEAGDAAKKNLVYGETDRTFSSGGQNANIPIYTLLNSASLEGPSSVEANTIVDYFLKVSPPNRPDLLATIADYSAIEFGSSVGIIEAESDRGFRVRMVPDCSQANTTISATISGFVDKAGDITKVNIDAAKKEITITYNSRIKSDDCKMSVGVDSLPPAISFEEKADSSASLIKIKGVVSDTKSGVDRVEVYEGVRKLPDATIDFGKGGIDKNNPNRGIFSFSWEWKPDVQVPVELTFIAYDKGNNTSEVDVNAPKSIVGNNKPPVVTITSPKTGSTTNSDVLVEGIIKDDGLIKKLSYSLNGNARKDVTTSLDKNNFTFRISSNNLLEGKNTIQVLAEDSEGSTGTTTIEINYDRNTVIDKNIIGSWEGVGSQNNGSTWTIALEIPANLAIGSSATTIDYPSLKCSGFWTLKQVIGSEHIFEESITIVPVGPGPHCITSGTVEITYNNRNDTLNYSYKSGNSTATSTLTRVSSQSTTTHYTFDDHTAKNSSDNGIFTPAGYSQCVESQPKDWSQSLTAMFQEYDQGRR